MGSYDRMRFWPVFEVRQENLITFGLLDKRRFSGTCVLLLPSIGVLQTSFGKLLEFLPGSLGLGH